MGAFEPTSVRLWRALPRDERTQAARAFWSQPPEEAAALAAREIVKILRVRPQAFGRIPVEQRVRATAGLANPGEALADALLVALHLESRRPLLGAFLDHLGVAHEDGVLSEDAELPPLAPDAARKILADLVARFPAAQVRVYWNALWLQDRERWSALADAAESL